MNTADLSYWQQEYQGKTIVISGASGYLGSGLISVLNGIMCRLVLPLPRASSKLPYASGIAEYSLIQGDVSDRETWQQALCGADYVFHLAAHEHAHRVEYNPTLDLNVNALSVLHLLEVCRQEGFSPKIVFPSSANVVGLAPKLPVDETFPDNPLTIYAIHKLVSEKYLQYYAREFRIRSVTLRLSNVYGPVPDCDVGARVVLNRLVRGAVRGQLLNLYKNYSCVRDYLFIDDAVACFLAAGKISKDDAIGQHFVVGSGVGHRIVDVVNLIADRVALRTGRRPRIKLEETEPLEVVEWRSFVADISCFSAATGWSPRTTLVEGIDRTIDDFLSKEESPS